ncbi:MAG: tetratricopeptide repeat protein [Phycisphaerae bacterium]|nr:tetratricopeptide repeat protein [Phycisphaerae bacterium]
MIVAAVYANSLHGPLLRDDKTAIVLDRRASDPARWREIFTQTYWHGLNNDPIYRPLTTLSFLLNRMVTGDAPWGFRAVNITLHAVVCVAVYALALRLLGGTLGAWIAAALFAVHAVHTEAVTAIVGRADMAVTLLLVLITWVYLATPPNENVRPWRLGAVFLLTAIAVFCKETAFVVLPWIVFMVLWRRWAGSRGPESAKRAARSPARRGRAEWVLILGAGLVCASALGLRYALFDRLSRPGDWIPMIDNPLGSASPGQRILTAIGLLGDYLRLLVWPHPLCCDYSYPQIPVAGALTEPAVLVGLAWIAGFIVSFFLVGRLASSYTWTVAVWCLGFFLITYAMISNAVLVIGTIFGERLIYLPSVAFCMGFGLLIARLAAHAGPRGKIGIGLLCAGVLVANAVLTVRRNRDWRDPMALWSQSVRVCPSSARCWLNLAMAYESRGDFDKAAELIRRSLELYDGEWSHHHALAELLARRNDFEGAAAEHRRAFELAKGKFRVQEAYKVGQCYMALHRPAAAVRAFEVVIKLDPNYAAALNNMAYLQATSDPPVRDLDQAARHIKRAIELAPDSPTLLDTGVDVHLARGERDLAIQLLRRALSVADKEHRLHARLRQRLDELTASRPSTSPSATRPSP